MKYLLTRFIAIIWWTTSCSLSALAADRGGVAAQNELTVFWKKFKAAVASSNKAAVAEMTKYPLSMPYLVKAVKNKEDFLRRYNEIFKGEADAAQCFASAELQKESARSYSIYCPFKDTPNDRENAPIRFIFELTKTGWKFTGLDNINE